ncbi:RNF31 ligase, partial [Serilophus lunatus]|nr:RNF31 ligase [Serilophus lunatus]
PDCPLRGSLHGHHPRDCLSYLRDWDPPRLQRLLQQNWGTNGEILGQDIALGVSGGPSLIPLSRRPGGTPPGRRGHYSEYLVGLVNRHGLDPAPLYDSAELRAAAERHLA